MFPWLPLVLVFAGAVISPLGAQDESEPAPARRLPDRPDPREIPLPRIVTAFPSMPGVDQLPVRKEMPDALTMNDGTQVTTVAQFKQRQEEIRQTLEYYYVGHMPPPPGNVKGVETRSELVMGGKVRYRLVHLTFGPGEKLSLDVGILTPVGIAPMPVVIRPDAPEPPGGPRLPRLARGPTANTGTDILLPPEIALVDRVPGSRGPGAAGAGFGRQATAESLAESAAIALNHGYAYVTFNYNDCGEDTTLRLPDGSFAFRSTRFFPAYPGYDWALLGSWAWGTMRVVDYLQTDPSIDKTKIIVTGRSRIGKAALVSGAFDPRIAMVAPGASSGLGTPAYRFSGGATATQPSRGGKEGMTMLVMKYANWFSPNLHEFWGQPDKLPFDAHWFAALTAPRPFLMLEGTHDPNVVHNGVKQTWLAAQSSYALFGATAKLGVYWADRPHGFGDTDWDGLLAFADKHLLGKPVSRAFDLFPADTEATANQ